MSRLPCKFCITLRRFLRMICGVTMVTPTVGVAHDASLADVKRARVEQTEEAQLFVQSMKEIASHPDPIREFVNRLSRS